MKIVSLIAENVKKLIAIEIKPDGNLVEITGKNGQGKTSVLDSIWWALAGAEHLQTAPIRSGQKNARIQLRLAGEQDLVVTRKFARKDEGGYTTTLTVESADGARFGSPQTMLDKLLGELSFDPLAFARMRPAEQFETLKRFVPGFDFAQTELDQKADFDRRTAINRQAREAHAAAQAIVVPVETPEEPVDESALAVELEEVGKFNTELETRKARRESVAREISEERRQAAACKVQCDDLLAQIQNIRDAGTRHEAQADLLQEKLDQAEALPEPKDTTEVRHRMDAARLTNSNVARKGEKKRLAERAEELERQADEITQRREAREDAKRAAIAAAQMPVNGIDFGDGMVLLNGQPFEQASDAEQLRASVAIAMAANPKLRVIRIRDGSLLDADSMKLVAAMAAEKDFQVWVETVDSSGKMAFVLEDGRLKTQAEEAAS